MSRIYLEAKPVVIGFEHLYLVLRPDPVAGDIDSLSWRQSGDVLRGGVSRYLRYSFYAKRTAQELRRPLHHAGGCLGAAHLRHY